MEPRETPPRLRSVATQPAERVCDAGASHVASPLHVVLVEPEIPPNTGNVSRLCAATGCALHLVRPLGFSIGDRELKRAGLDYWDAVSLVVHESLEAALAVLPPSRWYASSHGETPYAAAPFARGDVLVFGKETAGLPAALLAAHPDRTLRIPMRVGAVRSLNLSSAVAIVTYTALERLGFPELT